MSHFEEQQLLLSNSIGSLEGVPLVDLQTQLDAMSVTQAKEHLAELQLEIDLIARAAAAANVLAAQVERKTRQGMNSLMAAAGDSNHNDALAAQLSSIDAHRHATEMAARAGHLDRYNITSPVFKVRTFARLLLKALDELDFERTVCSSLAGDVSDGNSETITKIYHYRNNTGGRG